MTFLLLLADKKCLFIKNEYLFLRPKLNCLNMKTRLTLFSIIFASLIIGACSSRQQQETPKTDENAQQASQSINSFFYDLERSDVLLNPGVIVTDAAHSGKYSSKLATKDHYSSTIAIRVKDLDFSKISKAKMSFWYYPIAGNVDASYILNVKDSVSKKDISWKPMYLKSTAGANNWYQFEGELVLTKEELNPAHVIWIYAMNNSANPFLIDDLKIDFN